MKKRFIILFLLLLLLTIYSCNISVDYMNSEQKEALGRLDPYGVYGGSFFGLSREELFAKESGLIQKTDDTSGPVFKELNNYYGHPAQLMFLFTGAKKSGSATYVLNLDINPANIEIYREITKDLIQAFGSNYTMGPNPAAVQSNVSFSEQDIVNALEAKQISTFYIKWNQPNVLQFNFVILKNLNSIQVGFANK